MPPNITVEVPNVGFRPLRSVEIHREDMRRTRVVYGDGGPLLRVTGLLEVERVRFRGGEIEPKIVRDMPLDPGLSQFLRIVTDAFRLAYDLDGEPYLERSMWSNDGVWQDGQPFWVTGVYNESLNPPTDAAGPPPETVRQPFLTEGPTEPAEEIRQAARGRSKAATEAQLPKEE